ncbi:MAG: hypothetical protein ACXAAH_03595 [Promethearchaeota archaeon]|jgi:hypothetical protein
MPIGLVIMKWDDRAGTEILARYPEEIVLTEKTLMQVYSTHEYSGESGMISLMIGSLNIASYYTGPKKNFYILLLLNLDDDSDAFEEGLIDISRIILGNTENDAFLQMIPTLFRRLSVYPTLSTEQRLALTYQDEVKRMVINRLRDEGVVSKSELMIWLKDQYKQGFIDVEGILMELIKREIVKEASVKGMPSELIFLIKDVVIMRVPPLKILKDPADRGLPVQLVENYKADARSFFQNYQPTEGDNLRVIDILTNPQVYETLRLLRTAVVTKNDLEKLRKKGVEDLDDVLKMLWDTQMIQVFQDERQNEYYALLSDFYLNLTFPKYLMNIIKTVYDQKSKADQVLIEYLTVLENTYTNIKATKKAKAKTEE